MDTASANKVTGLRAMSGFIWQCSGAVLWGAFLVVVGAAFVPKYEDKRVGPIHYDDVTLKQLCSDLRHEHGVPVDTWDQSAYERRLSFATAEPLSRLAVVKLLAKQTDSDILPMGCLNGSSFLSGVGRTYYLYEKMRPNGEGRTVSADCRNE